MIALVRRSEGRRLKPTASLVVALVLSLAALALTADAAGAAPARRALLIGVNDYALPSVPDLRGAVSDVERMRRLLETRMGFDPHNIVTLTDAQATRGNILAAIDRLVAEAQPDDVVYFHYSGHGSQAKDRDGDEPDGRDETIVAHDSRQSGVPDITDDELDRRFERLRTRNALLVFDSCHSGTITRSIAAATPRSIPADTRDELYPAATRAVVAVDALPHVLMTGAPADQEALDAPIGDGFVGLFTFALSRSLDQLGPDASPEVVHETMKRELRSLAEKYALRPPEPQLEAPPELLHRGMFSAVATGGAGAIAGAGAVTAVGVTAAVAGDSTAAGAAPVSVVNVVRRTWLDTQPVDAERLRLMQGVALNAQPGSKWALYGPQETAFRYGAALAAGAVESLAGPDSILRVTERRGALPAGARAIPLMSANASEGLRLRVEGVAGDRAARLVAGIAQRLPVQQAAAGQPYRFLLELREGAWRLQDAAGLRQFAAFVDGENESVAASVATALQPLAEAAGLLSLDNLASDLKLWVGVQTAASTPAGTRAIVLVSDDPKPAYRIRRTGEPRGHHNSLVLELQADRAAYVTVVDVDAEGRVNQLFPNPAQKPGYLPDGRIPGGTLVRIPDSVEPGNAAGFYYDYGPPAGRDTVRVFAAADLATASAIRRFVQAAAAGSRATTNLGAALADATVRGIKVSTEQAAAAPADTTGAPAAPGQAAGTAVVGEWTAASVVVEIAE